MTALASLGAQANGDQIVSFRCPGCDDSHQVRIGENGWTWNGSLELPTFQPSVLVNGVQWADDAGFYKPKHKVPAGEKIVCHSFVTDGRIQFLGDCTHELAGQTVDLPPWHEGDDR